MQAEPLQTVGWHTFAISSAVRWIHGSPVIADNSVNACAKSLARFLCEQSIVLAEAYVKSEMYFIRSVFETDDNIYGYILWPQKQRPHSSMKLQRNARY